jgi:sugar O-acyltransferase (sialic acid O-acetyltransferase NeuD family)
MKKQLLIYGAGGLGREILALAMSTDLWEPIGFIDDIHPQGTMISGFKVLGGIAHLNAYPTSIHVIIAIGNPESKRMIVSKINNSRIEYPVLIHPSAILHARDKISLGGGSVLCAGSILTTDIIVGAHVLINLNCTIGHDTIIGDFTSVMPGVNIAGEVHLGKSVLIGAGSNIINKAKIGASCIVGMGAAVIKDVPDNTTVVGVPAKPIDR